MGHSPESSVGTQSTGSGAPNLFVADGSTMPTQGSANPALTVMALASRLASKRVGTIRAPSVATPP